MPFIAPWLQIPDYLGAMRSGAGLGLQLRQQADAEQARAASEALQRQSLFQQAQAQQANRALQQQEALMHQQNAVMALQQQAGYHADTLAEQEVDNRRADAAQALQGRRDLFAQTKYAADEADRKAQEATLNSFRERTTKLAEDKAAAGTAYEKKIKSQTSNAMNEFKSIWGEPTPQDVIALEQSVGSGEYRQPVGDERVKLAAAKYLATKADEVANDIEKFNEKYGNGQDLFTQKYTGIANTSLDKINRSLNTKGISPQDRDAYAIAQKFQTAFNRQALINSGAAVTAAELPRLESEIGKIASGNFVNEVNGFRDQNAKLLVDQVRDLRGRRNISKEMVRIAHDFNKRRSFYPDSIINDGAQEVDAGSPAAIPSAPLSPAEMNRLLELRARRGR